MMQWKQSCSIEPKKRLKAVINGKRPGILPSAYFHEEIKKMKLLEPKCKVYITDEVTREARRDC